MKETLEQQGWKCSKCNCSGNKGYDCAHADFRGVIIKLVTTNYFRIFRKGRVIASGHGYELAAKMKDNELIKATV